jgi:hypothetical protein
VHVVHASSDSLPVRLFALPAAHGVHAPAPIALHAPAKHGVHVDALRALNEPAAHARQARLAGPLKEPGSQATQEAFEVPPGCRL